MVSPTTPSTRRISIGGALARAAITALVNAGIEMREAGSFGWIKKDFTSGSEVTRLLRAGTP